MFQQTKPFERELRFTKAYRDNINKDKAIREYECLKEQVPQSFRTLKNKDRDIFVGRIEEALIGFYPIFAGKNGLDNTAYCINEDKCYDLLQKMILDGTYDPEEINIVKEMIGFWQEENTVTKTKKRMTVKMKDSLTGDDYNTEIGACYPLYRIAGIHLDAKKLLKYGLTGLIDLIAHKMKANPKSESLYKAMIGSLEILQEVCQLYKEELERLIADCDDEKRKVELQLMHRSISNIKEKKPNSLHEAIQLITLYMLASGTREIGRLDDYLCDFYVSDWKDGTISRELAVRMVVNFFEIIEEEFHRDTRAIIGGYGRENENNANEFALIVLDALDLRPMNFLPQVSLRYYRGIDERVYHRALDILAKGRTFPILYNDDVNVKSVMNAMEVTREVAQQYAFFGCGEYMLSGKSIGTPNVLINMAKVLEVTLNNGVDPITGKHIGLETGEMSDGMLFYDLMDRYQKHIDYFADLSGSFQELVYDICNEESSFLLVSILYDDCINRGKALFDGGIYHLGGTVETYGNITASDSLCAIKEIVFEQKKLTITKLMEVLKVNFSGYEKEQQMLMDAEKFGNDYEDADQIAVKVHEMICHAIKKQHHRTRLDSLLIVIINNNMNVRMGVCTGATPDGRIAFQHLSNANGAYNGRDKEGITALMKSMTKLDTSIHAGANQNFKFSTELFRNRDTIKALLGGFFSLGGQQTNISVVNQKDLEDALLHPEEHENLVVRVGGYTARFIHLDKKTQQDVLMRKAY
ncbi:MAG: pyruvate formate-lyase [Herbinix sp.]|jgi:pyruvate-formate lyase|nr:pyruvate formate-lyase [Herbinix sp.]